VAEHDNAQLVRRYFEAVHRDPSETAELYHPGATLHYSGTHRLSGDHRGVDAVLDLFRLSREAFHGTQRLEVHDVLADDEHAVALLAASAELDRQRIHWHRVVVFHASAGRITEQWIVDADQPLVDAIVGR